MTTKTTKAKPVDPRGSKPSAPAKTARKSIEPAPASPTGAAPPAAADPVRDASFGRRMTTEEKAKEKAQEMVSVTAPRAFKFTTDAYVMIDYPVGIYEMPRAHAEDSFSIAHGVTIND